MYAQFKLFAKVAHNILNCLLPKVEATNVVIPSVSENVSIGYGYTRNVSSVGPAMNISAAPQDMSQRLPYVVRELHDVSSSYGGQDTQLLPFSAAVTTRRSKYGGPSASRSERFPEIVTTRQTLKVLSDSEYIRWLNHMIGRIWPICILLPIVPWFLQKYKPWTVV